MNRVDAVEERLAELTSEISRLEKDLTKQYEVRHGVLDEVSSFAVDQSRRVCYLESVATDVSSALNAAAVTLEDGNEPRRLELQKTREDKEVTEKRVETLRQVVEVSSCFDAFDAAVEDDDLKGAMTGALKLEEAVGSLAAAVLPPALDKENAHPSEAEKVLDAPCGSVLRILKRLARRRRTQLESWLKRLVSEAVVFEGFSLAVHARVGGHALGDVFQAIFDLDFLEEVQIDLMCLLMDHILVPLLTRRGRQDDIAVITHPTSTTALLQIDLDDSLSPHLEPLRDGRSAPVLLEAISAASIATDVGLRRTLQALVFIHEALFQGNLLFTAAFGQTLLLAPPTGAVSTPSHPHLLHSLCHMVLTNLPESPKNLPPLVSILSDITSSFDRQLFAMGFLPVEASSLSDLASQLELRHASFRRTRILSSARAALLGDYHNCVPARDAHDAAMGSPPDDLAALDPVPDDDAFAELRAWASGLIGDATSPSAPKAEDGLLLFPHSQVTTTAQTLATLVHKSLLLAIEASAPAALLLYHTARDLFDLFRALVPAQHGSAIHSVPRLAALLFNDCGFLAHAALTVGFVYRARLPPGVAEVACCVDLAQPLRQLADETLREAWLSQREQVLSFLVPTSEPTPRLPLALADTTTRRVLHHLHQLQTAWQSVLPARVYARALGGLTDVVLSRVTSAVFEVVAGHNLDARASKRPLEAPLVHGMGATFRTLTTGLAALFERGAEDIAARSAGARFFAVKTLLSASLADVADGLGRGTYKDLAAAEVGALVEAVFPPDAARANLLAAVHR